MAFGGPEQWQGFQAPPGIGRRPGEQGHQLIGDARGGRAVEEVRAVFEHAADLRAQLGEGEVQAGGAFSFKTAEDGDG